MANAPTPGMAQADQAASRLFRMTVAGETLDFMPSAVSLEERVKIRREIGLPIEAFGATELSIGEDTLAVYWWLAQRQNGKPNLSWKQFGFTWTGFDPARGDEVELVTDDDEATDSPEGSGPGSEAPSLA